MFVITKKANQKNGIEVMVDNNSILWLNEKHV